MVMAQPAFSQIDEPKALELARTAEEETGLTIVINDRVLYWLNKSTGTASARKTMRTRLQRMQTYRPMIQERLEERGLPTALLAVPILESGYKNFKKHQIAGLWSFMRQTARGFGLKVNKTTDERLNPAKSSAAAAAYFETLYKMFGDWNLALLAYNAGENAVQKVIDKAGHRDVFKLADEGHLKRKVNRDYVPKFLATVIIMAHPELVSD